MLGAFSMTSRKVQLRDAHSLLLKHDQEIKRQRAADMAAHTLEMAKVEAILRINGKFSGKGRPCKLVRILMDRYEQAILLAAKSASTVTQ
jgi:hypothetical protein